MRWPVGFAVTGDGAVWDLIMIVSVFELMRADGMDFVEAIAWTLTDDAFTEEGRSLKGFAGRLVGLRAAAVR